MDRRGRAEGVTAQEKWGRAYAAQTWPGVPVRVFADNDVSAASDDVVRPKFELLKAAIERGEVVQVWAVEQYRVERREVAWFEFAALMDDAGIPDLHTNRDGVVRVRDEVAGIKAVLGAGEVRRMKRRLNDTLAEKAALGQPQGGSTFGYRHAKNSDGVKTYVVVPEQAEAIRQAAEWVLTGWSLAHIAAELGKRGLRGARGGAVGINLVKSMVTCASVAGYRVHQGEIVGRGNWEPILDEQTWQACRLRLSQSRRVVRADGGTRFVPETHTGYTARRYLLTGGLVVCGVCGHRLVGGQKTMGDKKVPYLLCHSNSGGRYCVGILADNTEEFVVGKLFDELDKPEFLNAIAADAHGPHRDRIVAGLDALERRRRELATMWATPGELTNAEWREARGALAENERRLRAELDEIPPPVMDVDIAGAREAWPDMTLDEKREFVRLFIERVTVVRGVRGRSRFDSDRITITWRSV